VLSLGAARAADFRLPTPEELPGASEDVREALAALERKEAGEAVKRLQAAAGKGDANAQFVLGLCLQFGQGVTQSVDEARAMYAKAAASGQAAAQFFLGMFLLGGGEAKTGGEPKDGIVWLEKAALQKFHRANHQLADVYLGGLGVARDLAKAREWLQKSSADGDPVSSYRLAIMAEKGEGLEKPDPEAALKLYEKAAEDGLPEAMIYLGRMHESGVRGASDLDQARAYYEKAEKLKSAEARFRLGQLHELGRGVKKDETRAVFYYRKGAEQNEPNCIFQMGRMAAAGTGTKKDEKEAREWFKRAAQMNFAPAIHALGVMSEEGQGGAAKDDREALQYYLQAGEIGDAASQNKLGVWYRSGEGPVLKDNVAAAAWFGLAVQSGYAAAQVNLGLMAEEGAGMPRNYALAGQLFESAAAQGHGLGLFFMARLLEKGSGTSPDPVGAYVLYEQAAAVHAPAAEARDALKKKLTTEQLKAAEEQLAARRAAAKPPAAPKQG
jgi:TPR repeat protein